MASGIDRNRDSMALFGEPAWHKFGTVLSADDPARFNPDEAYAKSGIDKINPEFREMYFRAADGTYKLASTRAIVRTDHEEELGVVGKYREIVKPSEMLAVFNPFVESGECRFETIGSLFAGRIIFVTAEIINREPLTIVPDATNPDIVKKYLSVVGSYDNSVKLHVKFTPQREVCKNTVDAAMRNATAILRMKQTKNVHRALESVQHSINLADQEFEATGEQLRRMVRFGVNQDDIVMYVKKILNVDPEKKIAKKTENIIDELVELATNGKGSEYAPNSLWTAFNGVTEYVTHRQGRSDERRLYNSTFSGNKSIASRAYDLALQLMS